MLFVHYVHDNNVPELIQSILHPDLAQYVPDVGGKDLHRMIIKVKHALWLILGL